MTMLHPVFNRKIFNLFDLAIFTASLINQKALVKWYTIPKLGSYLIKGFQKVFRFSNQTRIKY